MHIKQGWIMGLRGGLLRQIRERNGISQREAARDTGLGEHAVHRMEIGEGDPGIGKVAKLAEFLDVSLDYLTGRTVDPKAHKGVQGLTPDESEFLSALRRRDYETTFTLLSRQFGKNFPDKPDVPSSQPPTHK